MTKIDVISGFLGAGKTTLIKKLLNEAIKDKVVLIENEFGEIGVDGSFLKDSGIEIKEMNSGCICCSLVGDFEKSLKEVIDTYNPERIIIEPSGVGKLSDIITAINNCSLDIKINSLTTIVDGSKCKMYVKNFGEFFNDQINSASTIIISRADKLTNEKIEEAVSIIKEVNEIARIITTPISELNGEVILQVMEDNLHDLAEELKNELEHEHCFCGHHHEHDHDHDEECCCGHHHEHDHDHDEECCCGHHHEHDHDHDEECCCGHHHEHDHDHDEECCCGHHHEHDHDHDEECCCGHHHEHDHDHDEECCCGHHHEHDHDHDEECCCGHHHEHDHDHDEECSCGCGHHHHHGHDADEVFTSIGIETVKEYSKEQLQSILQELSNPDSEYGFVLRAKGILKGNNEWLYFDLTPEEYEIRTGNPDFTGRICVIGSKLDEEKIKKLFK